MLALHPPFRAKDMNELFTKVTAGVFESPPKCYSPDLTSLISSMIRVNPKDRPSAEQLLQTPIVKLKTSQLNLTSLKDEKKLLLQTIKFPKNLKSLRLP